MKWNQREKEMWWRKRSPLINQNQSKYKSVLQQSKKHQGKCEDTVNNIAEIYMLQAQALPN